LLKNVRKSVGVEFCSFFQANLNGFHQLEQNKQNYFKGDQAAPEVREERQTFLTGTGARFRCG
jgi:hypothetical protein